MRACDARRSVWTACACAMSVLAATLHGGEIVEDFSEGGWRPSNPKAPAEVTQQPGRLVLRDLPGGEVTWGSSASKRFEDVDLSETPYFVVEVGALEGGFQVKLAGGRERPKTSVLQGRQPGRYVLDIPLITGWPRDGKAPMTVMIYTQGDGTAAEYRGIRITGTLTEDEASRLGKLPGSPRVHGPEHAGLAALAQRRISPPDELPPGETERVVYTDAVTGRQVWRFTGHPAIDRHVYYDIPAWNADGSLLYWISRRPGGRNWLANADGTDPRPLPAAADGGPLRAPHWHPKDPTRMLFARPAVSGVSIFGIDVDTGAVRSLIEVPAPPGLDGRRFSEFCPPHPDGEWFLLRWGGQDRNHTVLVAVDAAEEVSHHLELGFPTHRVRFTKAADHSIFVNSNIDPERPGVRSRTEWLVTLGGAVKRLPSGGGHPDWTPDGSLLGVYADGCIWLIGREGGPRELLLDIQAGGHGGFSITSGRYHVSDAPRRGPYANLIFVTEMTTRQVTPIAWHGSSYSGWGSGVPDPEATHPAPICSPDETKIVYDSDVLGQPEVFVAVWKRPQAPREVILAGNTLTWQPPALSREIAVYAIYERRGSQWTLRATLPAERREIDLPEGAYAVASREHSGLESLLAPADGRGLTRDGVAPPRPDVPVLSAAGMTHACIRWEPVAAPDVSHYNVYAADSLEQAPGRASVIRSPHGTGVVDWGIQPGRRLFYRVTAVDWQGNESLPSAALDVTLPGRICAPTTIQLEAEAADLESPMVVGIAADASGGAFVHVPDSFSDEPYVEVGHVVFRFRVPGDGIFTVWARALGLDGQSDSFYVSLDDGDEVNWGVRRVRDGAPAWFWQRVDSLDGVLLRQGVHQIRFRSREDGTRLDRVVITNDLGAEWR